MIDYISMPAGINGERYLFVGVLSGSKYWYLKAVNMRADAHIHILDAITDIGRDKIAIIRGDNEFDTTIIREICRDRNIQFQLSLPYVSRNV